VPTRCESCIQLYRSLFPRFRSNNSPSPVCMSMFPLPGPYKKSRRMAPVFPVLQTTYKPNRLHIHSHLFSCLTPRTTYSPGHLRIPDKASCSTHGASSTASKYISTVSPCPDDPDPTFLRPTPMHRARARPLFGVRYVRTKRIEWPG
jgi:hypothetical protein